MDRLLWKSAWPETGEASLSSGPYRPRGGSEVVRSCRVLGAGEPVGERRRTRERGWLRTVRRPGEGRGGREAGAWGARSPPSSGSPPLPSGGSLRSAYLTCPRPQLHSHSPTTRLPIGSARPLSPWHSSGGCCPLLWRWPWAPLPPQRAPPGRPTS